MMDDPHNPATRRAAQRRAAQRALSIAHVPDSEMDEVARQALEATGGQAAMVNIIGHDVQTFAGLATRDPNPGESPFHARVDRTMGRDAGFCIHATERTAGLLLDDVTDSVRNIGNDAIDVLGVRAYGGMQILASAISPHLADAPGEVPLVLGTVCVVNADIRTTESGTAWDPQRVKKLKSARDLAQQILRRRQAIAQLLESVAVPAMITTGGGAVLYLNTSWEDMFGQVQDLGVPAARVFPALADLGALSALEQVQSTGQPRGVAVGNLALAVVPATVPGQSTAALTLLHPADSNPIAVALAAARLAEAVAALPRTT